MLSKNSLAFIILLLVLTGFSIYFIDRPLANYMQSHLQSLENPLYNLVSGIEIVSGFTISKFLLGLLLLIAGFLIYAKDKSWQRANIFLFIGTTHIVSRLVAGTLKNLFDRTRPYQYLKERTIGDFFVEGGSSFPSGHTAHFFSLFFAFFFLFPRFAWWFLIMPLIVFFQRVISNDHYLSDVLAGILIAFIFALAFEKLFFHINKGNAYR